MGYGKLAGAQKILVCVSGIPLELRLGRCRRSIKWRRHFTENVTFQVREPKSKMDR